MTRLLPSNILVLRKAWSNFNVARVSQATFLELLNGYEKYMDYKKGLETLLGIFQAEHRLASVHRDQARALRLASLIGFIAQLLVEDVS